MNSNAFLRTVLVGKAVNSIGCFSSVCLHPADRLENASLNLEVLVVYRVDLLRGRMKVSRSFRKEGIMYFFPFAERRVV